MTHKLFRGLGASQGIVSGPLAIFSKNVLVLPPETVYNFQFEWERFQLATARVALKLTDVEKDLACVVDNNVKKLVDTILVIVNDTFLQKNIKQEIFKQHLNAEHAVLSAFKSAKTTLSKVKNPHIAEKIYDLDAAQDMLLEILSGQDWITSPDLAGKIVAANNFSPRDILLFSKQKIAGLVCETGSKISHIAILARNFNIPAILGVTDFCAQITAGEIAVLDGGRGIIETSPSAETLNEYLTHKNRWQNLANSLIKDVNLSVTTLDNNSIQVLVNLDSKESLEVCNNYNVDGVGLYRLESFFSTKKALPTEADLSEELSKIASNLKSKPFTTRLLDIGGEKTLPFLNLNNGTNSTRPENPALGIRGVRLLLKNKDILLLQCRAIIQANTSGNIRVLIPFVTCVEEIRNIKEALRQTWEAQNALGLKTPFPQVGVMIELPAAAAITTLFARECDFFSIGSNDLTQHSLAIDRLNAEVEDIFDSLHPAIIRLIHGIIQDAKKTNTPVSLCGELASDPLAIELLLGMGLQQFSVGVHAIPQIKDIIRHCSFVESQILLQQVLEKSTTAEIRAVLKQRFMEKFGREYFSLIIEDFEETQSK